MELIDHVDVAVYVLPTASPESDGTFEWNETTMVVAEAGVRDRRGLGYTPADRATGVLVEQLLRHVVRGRDPMDVAGAWQAMIRAVRNLGVPGIASMAVAAIDVALWDLKARLLDLPLVRLLGAVRSEIAVYGSGGFTSYSIEELQHQLRGWVAEGMTQVKMKVGREPSQDARRVGAARAAIGPGTALLVDANGAYSTSEALAQADHFAACDVSWFEEPVPSDDLDGLRRLRDRAPAGMAIVAGEYGYTLPYFRSMLAAGAVDILQADATRCAGITGFLQAAVLCEAAHVPLSAHTAPSLHGHLCCVAPAAANVEYFFDHARIEQLLFDGALTPYRGALRPDRTRAGLGLALKRAEAAQYAV